MLEKIPVWCRCPLWHHKWQFFSTGFLKKRTSTKEYKWQMGLSIVLWQPEDVLLLTEKGCIVSTYKLPSDWFWSIFSTNQSFQFCFALLFDRHIGDVSVSYWCRWPHDGERLPELLHHRPGKHSRQRHQQGHVWHQQPDRKHLHQGRRPGPRGEVQAEMETYGFSQYQTHWTKMPCALCQVVKSFRLRLQIADMGGMGLTSEGVAIIHVSDINNNVPQFSPASVSLSRSLASRSLAVFHVGRPGGHPLIFSSLGPCSTAW